MLSNHDIDRACDRFADDANADAVAKLLAALLLTLRGAPFVYYGEEIAMRTEPPKSLDEVRDPVGRRFWPYYKGRDGVRRPMQWDGSSGAGFSRGTPWLGVSHDSSERNVAWQLQESDSILNFYRTLLHLRRDTPALAVGDFVPVSAAAGVVAFARTSAAESLIVALNVSAERRDAGLPPTIRGAVRGRVMAGTHRPAGLEVDLAAIVLAPLEAVVLRAV